MKNFPTLILLLFVFSLAACSDDKTAENSCKTQLDNSEFQAIIDNEGCSNYERASAYLGRAGFSFANFMKDGASNNFSTTLGIDSNWNDNTTGVQNDYTNAICLVGSDNFVNSNCKNNEVKRDTTVARKGEDLEISFFGLMGDLILKTYGNLDTDHDGTISSSEQNAFTGVKNSDSNAGASMGIQQGVFQLIDNTSDASYFYDGTSCYNAIGHTGVFDNSSALSAPTCASILGASTELYPIIQINAITPIFDSSVVTKSYKPTTFLTDYSARAKALNEDLEKLGLKEGSELRKNLKESVDKMDNGASCKNVRAFDLVKTIAVVAADNTTASVLKVKNLLKLDELGKVDPTIDSALKALVSPVSSLSIKLGRLVYKKGAAYTDDYDQADTDLETALTQIRGLSLYDNGTIKETSANDGIIDFRELICLSEQ